VLHIPAVPTMIVLDGLMILFTLWVVALKAPLGRLGAGLGAALLGWLLALHLGLSAQALFPPGIGGSAFLAVIVGAVALVGAVLFGVAPVRALLWRLEPAQLMLLQGVRVFFGAGFLVQAATGELPAAFGVIDGLTHIAAGFFGLVAAHALATGVDGARRAMFANLFGLADILVVASSLALLLLPQIGPHHTMMYAVFLPAPLWLWFHLLAIAKLRRGQGRLSRAAAA
jgi:hypothetical protein